MVSIERRNSRAPTLDRVARPRPGPGSPGPSLSALAGEPATRGRKRAVSTLLTALRRDLAEGAYHPHERLVEADLVARYGTTRAAVREGLIQLATEQLVERAPNRGARVRGMTLDEAIEIAEVRRELETLTAARAAARGSEAERHGIARLAESLREAAATGEVDTYLALNARYHRLIDEVARHTTARQILDQFRNRPIDRFLPEPFRATPPTASVDAHLRIAAAIADGDAVRAAAAMHGHLTELIDILRQYEQRSLRRS